MREGIELTQKHLPSLGSLPVLGRFTPEGQRVRRYMTPERVRLAEKVVGNICLRTAKYGVQPFEFDLSMVKVMSEEETERWDGHNRLTLLGLVALPPLYLRIHGSLFGPRKKLLFLLEENRSHPLKSQLASRSQFLQFQDSNHKAKPLF